MLEVHRDRCAILMDVDRVVGASTDGENGACMPLLPAGLPEVMMKQCQSDNLSVCYATYSNAIIGGDVVENIVTYRLPRPESTPIAGHICFYDEKVAIDIDGQGQARPKTIFA